MSSDFEIGEKVMVASASAGDWIERTYAGRMGMDDYCLDIGGGIDLVCWEFVSKIPTAPKLVPFTEENFPKQAVWLDREGTSELVVSVDGGGVVTRLSVATYQELLEEWDMSLDYRKTWQPAGVLV